jgi:thymidylate synthase (FAD)
MQVLDKGYIELRDRMGGDLSVVRAARISYDAEWRTGEDEGKDEKLISYLLKNNHTSPFEHVFFTFEIKCPMFIGEQWLRHRTWKFNKISGRYTELPKEFYLPDRDQITTQSTHNKQMRTDEVNENSEYIRRIINDENEESFHTYKSLLKLGCPRELARGVLTANIYTRMVASVDLHNLLHFLRLRLHEHAQYEIRVYAEAIMKLIEPIVPITLKAFKTTL